MTAEQKQYTEKGLHVHINLDSVRKRYRDLRQQADQREELRRYEDLKNQCKKALVNRGYQLLHAEVEISPDYLRIKGENNQGGTAWFDLLKPESKQEKLDAVRMQIGDETFDDQALWEHEGRELIRELKSLGVQIEFRDAMTHFKNKVLQQAVMELQKKWQKRDPSVKIEFQDNQIRVNGETISWPVGMAADELITALKDSAHALSPQIGRDRGKLKQRT